jgi:hypothetical protein
VAGGRVVMERYAETATLREGIRTVQNAMSSESVRNDDAKWDGMADVLGYLKARLDVLENPPAPEGPSNFDRIAAALERLANAAEKEAV